MRRVFEFLLALFAAFLASCAQPIELDPPAEEREILTEIVLREAEDAPRREEYFTHRLSADSPRIRARALCALSRCDGGQRVRRLIEALHADADPSVQMEAAYALGRIRDPSSAGVLADALHSSGAEVRAAAVRAIGFLPDPSAGVLAACLSDQDWSVRREAVFALARLGARAPPEILERLARTEEDERVRWAVYWALARSRAPGPGRDLELARAVRDPNFFAAAFAMTGLESVQGPAPVTEILSIARDDRAPAPARAAAAGLLKAWRSRDLVSGEERASIDSLLGNGTQMPGALPIPFFPANPRVAHAVPRETLRPFLAWSLRNPRVEIQIASRGSILLDLYAWEAPKHVAAFVRDVRGGWYAGRRIARADPLSGVFLSSGGGGQGASPVALPHEETRRGGFLPGAVFSPGDVPGALFIARIPLPELDGAVGCWGKVALGMEIVAALAEGDLIESVTLLDPTSRPFPANVPAFPTSVPFLPAPLPAPPTPLPPEPPN